MIDPNFHSDERFHDITTHSRTRSKPMVVGDVTTGTDVLVIGAGPAGYVAAIRAGQLELDVTLVERTPTAAPVSITAVSRRRR